MICAVCNYCNRVISSDNTKSIRIFNQDGISIYLDSDRKFVEPDSDLHFCNITHLVKWLEKTTGEYAVPSGGDVSYTVTSGGGGTPIIIPSQFFISHCALGNSIEKTVKIEISGSKEKVNEFMKALHSDLGIYISNHDVNYTEFQENTNE